MTNVLHTTVQFHAIVMVQKTMKTIVIIINIMFCLSLLLFRHIVMDVSASEVGTHPPWGLLFADDLALCAESSVELEEELGHSVSDQPIFLLNLRDSPPISMKFGTLADNA